MSHNGGLIPVPGRDIMVQGWYQGGVSVMDFTNSDKPEELAYFDRGPIDPPPQACDVPVTPPAEGGRAQPRHDRRLVGRVLLERLHLLVGDGPRVRHPRAGAERAAVEERDRGGEARAGSSEYNPQSQPKIEWPAAFPVVRSYLDQLVRWNGLAAERTTAIANALDAAEQQSGKARRNRAQCAGEAGGEGRRRARRIRSA